MKHFVNSAAPEEGGCVHNISQAKLLFFPPATCHLPLEQEKLFLCLPPQELTDLEIFAPSNTKITFKIPKCDMFYLRVIIPKYLYVINDPPCNSVYAAKRLNKRLLLLLSLHYTFYVTDWFTVHSYQFLSL